MPDQDTSQPAQKVFDFEEAVAEARRDFPRETKNITFIDLSAPDAQDQIYAWALKAKLNQIQYDSLADHASKGSAVARETNGERIIAIPTADEDVNGSFPGDAYKSIYFSFQHELGHFVIPNGHAASSFGTSTEYREHAADSFAIMRGLKAGVFSKADVVALADGRGHGMLLTEDITHLTSMSLDAIAINPKNIDFLSLSKEDIVKVAQRHAATFELSGPASSRFLSLQFAAQNQYDSGATEQEVLEQKLMGLQEICMSAPAESQEFYVAARILNNVLETGTMRVGAHEAKVDVGTDYWKSVHEALLDKAGGRGIGAKKALESDSLVRPQADSGLFGRLRETFKPLKI